MWWNNAKITTNNYMAGAHTSCDYRTYIHQPLRNGFPTQNLYTRKNKIICWCAWNNKVYNQSRKTYPVTVHRGRHDNVIKQVYQQNYMWSMNLEEMYSSVQACSVHEQRNNRWQENQSQEAWHNVNRNKTKMIICCRLLYKNDHSQKVLRHSEIYVEWQSWYIRHILFNYLEIRKINCVLVVKCNETI